MAHKHVVGQDALQEKGWWLTHRYLVFRRVSQLGILVLFLFGPWFGLWLVKGNLSASLTLNTLPLTDPYVLLQTLFAGHHLEKTALVGAAIVLGFYLLVGGRAYCAWVCPVNIITDAAQWLRRKLYIKNRHIPVSNQARFWLLAMSLLLPVLLGVVVWELVNPVSLLHRGIIFGMTTGWLLITFIFLFDVLIANRGWCGRLCPVGAFYSLLGYFSFTKISADKREDCTDCMDCFLVCPEPQVIKPALKGSGSPIIQSAQCTNCARCIDICAPKVFRFRTRFK